VIKAAEKACLVVEAKIREEKELHRKEEEELYQQLEEK